MKKIRIAIVLSCVLAIQSLAVVASASTLDNSKVTTSTGTLTTNNDGQPW